jgi:endonuclease YncB( thermonuclease family)
MRAVRAAVALLLLSAAALAQAFAGVVTRVSDGDTVWVTPDDTRRKPVKLRLAGLDAPERCQPWGIEAGAALASRVLHRRVEVSTRAIDMHGRAIGSLFLDGDDIGAWLVEQGHAWSQRWQRNPGPYAVQERSARSERRGLFADASAITPREFRRSRGPCP